MDVKDKKIKLTLKNFSGGSAAVSSYARGAGNKSVLVEKKKTDRLILVSLLKNQKFQQLH